MQPQRGFVQRGRRGGDRDGRDGREGEERVVGVDAAAAMDGALVALLGARRGGDPPHRFGQRSVSRPLRHDHAADGGTELGAIAAQREHRQRVAQRLARVVLDE